MYSPAADREGVPDRRPVEALNDAQGGRFAIEKLKGLPSGSEAAGVNEYVWPETTDDGGVPEIDGAPLAGGDELSQVSRERRDLQFRSPASATVTKASTAASKTKAAPKREADED